MQTGRNRKAKRVGFTNMKNLISRTFALLIVLAFSNCKKKTIIPVPPSALTAIATSSTAITLNWTDNSTNESGFKIERKTGTGTYAQIASLGQDNSSYNDIGLAPNTSYTYRVYSFNQAGKSLAYTNEATATTLDPVFTGLSNGLLAYYPFTGNAGDSSGNNNHGISTLVSLSSDRFGHQNQAYSFNGNSLISIANNNNLNLSGNFSIASWVNLNALLPSNAVQMIVSNHFRDIGSDGYCFGIWASANVSQVNFQSNPDFSPNTYPGPNGAISANTWHHLAVVYIQGSAQLKYFLDGNLVGTKNIAFTPASNSKNLIIGAQANSTGVNSDFFIGKLDDIRIYNRDLSQTEITYLATH